jgi:predicted nucleic acid-binding protein
VIVADVNLLVYLLISGPFTSDAERAFARDRRWIAPRSHRFELLNVLSTNVRAGTIKLDQADVLWRKAFRLVVLPTTDVEPMDVLKLSVNSKVATYDCEYVVLARLRRLKLVTNDGGILRAFPDVAVSIGDFAAGK